MALNPVTCALSLVLVLASVKVAIVSATSQEGRMADTPLQSNVNRRMYVIEQHLEEATQELIDLDQELQQALFHHNQTPRSANDQIGTFNRLKANLQEKRSLVQKLRRSFQGADNALKTERKRSCSLNLGFHCRTEEISDFADVYDFLASSNSPGKKRSVRMIPRMH